MILRPSKRPNALVYCLIKFLDSDSAAENFLRGNLRFNRLSELKRWEEDDFRGDQLEATAAFLQRQGLEMHLQIPMFGRHVVYGSEMTRPLTWNFDQHDELLVHSMYAVYLTDVPAVGAAVELTAAQMAAWRDQLVIDTRAADLGGFAVVTPVKPFMERLREAAALQGWKMASGLVEYFDEESQNGHFPLPEIPFRKRSRYAFQREFRICIDTGGPSAPYEFRQMGTLERFAVKTPSERLTRGFELNIAA
jgi:hypothetical protein